MAFYLGGQRTTYFDIYVSPDGERYMPLCTDTETSGRTAGEEVYLICGSGRYIRFVGHGNSEGTFWNSLNEFIPVTAQ